MVRLHYFILFVVSVKGRFRVQERNLNAAGQNNSHGDEIFSSNDQNHGFSNQI